jgi:hypothetical protein
MTRPYLSLAVAIFVAAYSSSAPGLAQSACDPEKLSAAIDRYARTPFDAVSWRMLNGLGATDSNGAGPSGSGWAATDTWQKRVKELAPDMPELVDVPYECRMSYPLEVLEAHVAKLGAADPYIKQWLMAQARVLKACGGAGANETILPVPLEVKPELFAQQQDDRAYQEASVVFYGPDKTKAVEMFKAIAASASTHKAAARYNVANLLANAKNVVAARAEAAAILADPTLSSVHSITKELQGYIANLEDTAEGWSELIDNTVATLSQPASAVVADAKSKAEFAAALYDIDFVGVRDKQDDWWVRGVLPENPTLSKAIVDASRKHPMVLWMMTGQSVSAMQARAPWSMEGEKWNAWATSYVDRAMAIVPAGSGVSGPAKDLVDALKSGTDDASRSALWAKAKAAAEKAGSTCGEAPETAAVAELAVQGTRLAALSGQFEEVYSNLAALPLSTSSVYADRILPKLMQHVLASGNVEEGRRLRDRLLTPALVETIRKRVDYERDVALATFSDFLAWVAEDEAKFVAAISLGNNKLANPVLNLLPAKTLRRLAENPAFAPEQKALLSRAAWTRDYARGQLPKKADTDNMLMLNPDIKAALEKVKSEFPKLREDRAWLLTILRNPRFGILVNSPDNWASAIEDKRASFADLDQYDHNDKNWWCPLETDRQLGALRNSLDESAGLTDVRTYQAEKLKPVLEEGALANAEAARDTLLKAHAMVKAINWSEVKALATAASAPKMLTRAATRWAKGSKGADGAPEALARSIKVVRYGCNWHGGHMAYAKPAQQLLQAKFKDTTWAKETPYWFDCLHKVYDAQLTKTTTCAPQQWPKQAPLR